MGRPPVAESSSVVNHPVEPRHFQDNGSAGKRCPCFVRLAFTRNDEGVTTLLGASYRTTIIYIYNSTRYITHF